MLGAKGVISLWSVSSVPLIIIEKGVCAQVGPTVTPSAWGGLCRLSLILVRWWWLILFQCLIIDESIPTIIWVSPSAVANYSRGGISCGNVSVPGIIILMPSFYAQGEQDRIGERVSLWSSDLDIHP